MPDIFFEAEFLDGTKINELEYYNRGFKKPFNFVLARKNQLKRLSVSINKTRFSVDFIENLFFVSNLKYPAKIPFNADVRPIYYKVMASEIAVSGDSRFKPDVVEVCIGWQATKDGRNLKRIMKIDPVKKVITFEEKL